MAKGKMSSVLVRVESIPGLCSTIAIANPITTDRETDMKV